MKVKGPPPHHFYHRLSSLGMNHPASPLEPMPNKTSAGALEHSFPDLFLGFSTETKELLALSRDQQDSDSSNVWQEAPVFPAQLPAPASSIPSHGLSQPRTRKKLSLLPPSPVLWSLFHPTLWKHFHTLPNVLCVAEFQVCHGHIWRGTNPQSLSFSFFHRHMLSVHPSICCCQRKL